MTIIKTNQKIIITGNKNVFLRFSKNLEKHHDYGKPKNFRKKRDTDEVKPTMMDISTTKSSMFD